MDTDPIRATRKSILFVDDEESVARLGSIVLARAGYRVFTAADGAQALQIAGDLPHLDALVSDIEMPGIRGDELATQFSILHPAAAIVFISSANGPINAPKPFEFLHKPFGIDALVGIVHGAIAARAQSTP